MHPVLAVNKASGRWPFALRAAIAVAGPVLVAALLGDLRPGLMAGLGAFTVLYGANTAGRFRAKLLPTMGLGFVAAATLGVLTHGNGWLHLLAMVGVAVVASTVTNALMVGPPGAYFLVLVCGVAGFMAQNGQPGWLVIGMTAIGAAVSVAVGLMDLLWAPYGAERKAVTAAARAIQGFERDDANLDEARALASQSLHHAWTTVRDAGAHPTSRLQPIIRELTELQARYERRSAQFAGRLAGFDVKPWGAVEGEEGSDDSALTGVDREQLRDSSLGRPDASYLLRRGLRWPTGILLVGARAGIAALVSGVIALLLDVPHPYWAVAFAVLVLHQGGRRAAQTVRGIQRLLGTAVGLGLYALILWWNPHGIWVALLMAVLQFAIEVLVVRNYALAVMFITPLALTIASAAASPENPTMMIAERMFDSAIGIAVAVTVVWTVGRGTALLLTRANARRSIVAMEPVLDALAQGRVDTPDAARDRRHLYFELLRLQHIADQSAADEPARLRPYLPTFVAVAQLGYAVLGACWHPDSPAAATAAVRVRGALTRITSRPVQEYRDPVSLRTDVEWAAEQLREWKT
ncbi:MAG: FUSC family protein [Propionibacteriaceae bacterium]|nr:FUSC family protein [Propionibacteriaceae bacterium]